MRVSNRTSKGGNHPVRGGWLKDAIGRYERVLSCQYMKAREQEAISAIRREKHAQRPRLIIVRLKDQRPSPQRPKRDPMIGDAHG